MTDEELIEKAARISTPVHRGFDLGQLDPRERDLYLKAMAALADAGLLADPERQRPVVLLRAEDCACPVGGDCPHGPEPVDALDLAVWLHAEQADELEKIGDALAEFQVVDADGPVPNVPLSEQVEVLHTEWTDAIAEVQKLRADAVEVKRLDDEAYARHRDALYAALGCTGPEGSLIALIKENVAAVVAERDQARAALESTQDALREMEQKRDAWKVAAGVDYRDLDTTLEEARAERDGQLADIEQFVANVQADRESSCWTWTAAKDRNGYGRFKFRGRKWFAHRVSYTLFRGELAELDADGNRMVIDHLCRNRGCVNPGHLRLVTNRENLVAEGSLSPTKLLSERTHCPRGHALTSPNLRPGPLRRGLRSCLACARGLNNVRDARIKRGVELDPQAATDAHYARIMTPDPAEPTGEVDRG